MSNLSVIEALKKTTKKIKEYADTQLADITKQGMGLAKSISDYAYDDFDDVNQSLDGRVTPSGHTWSLSGVGYEYCKIEDRMMVADNNNFYATLDYGKLVDRIQATFSIVESGNENPTSEISNPYVLIMQGSPFNLGTMIHAQYDAEKLYLTKRLDGGDFIEVGTKTFDIRKDGTVYNVWMELNGNVLTVGLPDGTTVQYTDDDFVTINPTKCTWQLYPKNLDKYKTRFHGVSIGKRENGNRLACLDGATKKDITVLRDDLGGVGYSKRTTIKNTISESGWYKIADKYTLGSYIINGKLIITGSDSIGRYTLAEVDVKCNLNSLGTANIISCTQKSGGVITDIRLSSNASNIIVEVNCPNASTSNATKVNIEYRGCITPCSATTTTTLSNPATIKLSSLVNTKFSYTLATTGWYTIASEKSIGVQSAIVALLKINAYAAGMYSKFDLLVAQRYNSDTNRQLTQLNTALAVALPITKVRISRDETNSLVNLDVYCNVANTTFNVESDGCINLLSSPKSNATELTTLVEELTLATTNATT